MDKAYDIIVQNVSRTFKIHERNPGLWASFKSIFHRKYRFIDAVKEVNFLIRPGELVGYLGPNGAGKTTTLKILAGLLYPTTGNVSVLGFKP